MCFASPVPASLPTTTLSEVHVAAHLFHSEEEGEHDLSARVLLAKLLLVVLVLLDGPDDHLSDRDGREEGSGGGECQEGEGQPGDGLKEVVGTRLWLGGRR